MRKIYFIISLFSVLLFFNCSEEQKSNTNEIITEKGTVIKLETPLGKKYLKMKNL